MSNQLFVGEMASDIQEPTSALKISIRILHYMQSQLRRKSYYQDFLDDLSRGCLLEQAYYGAIKETDTTMFNLPPSVRIYSQLRSICSNMDIPDIWRKAIYIHTGKGVTRSDSNSETFKSTGPASSENQSE